jgi:hypothetical protein
MDHSKLAGLEIAKNFARDGKFIFAIKSLERANPGISREDAKAVIESFSSPQPARKAASSDGAERKSSGTGPRSPRRSTS